jgi:signal transduction histidine kinase
VTRLLHGRPITVRITAGFLAAMVVLLIATGAFVYERMNFALNRSIRDVPSGQRVEIDARRRHRDEALHELLVQLGIAFSGTLLVSGLVGHRVARAALDPVERMRRRASAESADLSFRLPVPDSADELSRLAETLNELLRRVQEGVAREQRFVADASHELRTPLSQMLLQADLLLTRDRTREELVTAVRGVQDDTRRLVRLANDLLLLARADEGQLALHREAVEVGALAVEVAGRYAATGTADIAVQADAGLVWVGDRDRLGQALGNLIDNALAHGGGAVRIDATRSDGTLAVCVSDDGPGFPPEFLDRAFDRFATATPARTGAGSGLGLSIVAAIAAAHEGSVRAANRPGGGSEVTLRLPG